jgi:hypothetical protein
VAGIMSGEFVSRFTNTFIIRDPAPVIASLYGFWPDFTLEETGYEQQHRLFGLAVENGEDPAVVDAADLTADPEGTIRAYCEKLGVPFMPESLTWETGDVPGWEMWTGGTKRRRRAPASRASRSKTTRKCGQAWKASMNAAFRTTQNSARSSCGPPDKPRSVGVFPHHQDRAVCVLDHGVRDAAQERATQAAQAAAPDNDKFRAQFLGELQDLGVRASHPQVGPRDPCAGGLDPPRLLVQDPLRVLPDRFETGGISLHLRMVNRRNETDVDHV